MRFQPGVAIAASALSLVAILIALSFWHIDIARDGAAQSDALSATHEHLALSIATAMAAILLAALILWVSLVLPGQLRRELVRTRRTADAAAAEAIAAQHRLAAAIEAVPGAFALFDPQDRLVVANAEYHQLMGGSGTDEMIGQTFEALLRRNVVSGIFRIPAEGEDAFIRSRMAAHAEPSAPVEVSLQDGRWILVTERRTPDGGTVESRTDITDLKRRNARHEEQRILLRTTLESLDEAVCVFDDRRQLTLWNQKFTKLVGVPSGDLTVGMSFAELIACKGIQSLLTEEDFGFTVGRRDRQSGTLELGVRALDDGRTVRIQSAWTPGGHTVLTFVDLSDISRSNQALRASENRLRDVMEASPVGVAVLDPDNLPMFINTRWQEMFGQDSNTLSSGLAAVVAEQSEWARLQDMLSETGRVNACEMRLRRGDGTLFWGTVTIRRTRFQGVAAALAYVFDITEIKAAQEMLERSNAILEEKVVDRVTESEMAMTQLIVEVERNALLAAVINASNAGITIADGVGGVARDMPIVYCNPSFERITGWRQDEIKGKSASFLIGPDTAPEAREAVIDAIEQGHPVEIEMICYRKSGEPFWNRLSLFPVHDTTGKVRQIVGQHLDITERREVAAEQARLQARIAEAGKFEALGTLAGGIAHEINTPTQYVGDNIRFLESSLGDILTLASSGRIFAESVAETTTESAAARRLLDAASAVDLDFLETEIPAAINQSLDGVERITQIVQAIKEFSHPTDRQAAPFDLNHAIHTAVTVARNQWKYVADVRFDLDPALPMLVANQGEINQVLLNMIVNAAHAIEEARRTDQGTIAIGTRSVDDMIELTIGDDGIGIPPDRLNRIFELFYTTKPPGKGTGQGLAICQSIVVQRHGGQIRVDSSPGEGTRFTILLPRKGPETGNSAAAEEIVA